MQLRSHLLAAVGTIVHKYKIIWDAFKNFC